ASLAGVPPEEVTPLLNELTYANLVNEHVPGRYAFHDLLRAYAAERSNAEDPDNPRDGAIHRVLDHYVHSANAHTMVMNPGWAPFPLTPPASGTTDESPKGVREALSWFTVEHHVLLAAIDQAQHLNYDTHIGMLTWTM